MAYNGVAYHGFCDHIHPVFRLQSTRSQLDVTHTVRHKHIHRITNRNFVKSFIWAEKSQCVYTGNQGLKVDQGCRYYDLYCMFDVYRLMTVASCITRTKRPIDVTRPLISILTGD
jgi:hypothetical protein